MLQPTKGHAGPLEHTHFVRSGSMMMMVAATKGSAGNPLRQARDSNPAELPVPAIRLQHQGSTPHEVSMLQGLVQPFSACAVACRLEHHRPTFYKVGMREFVMRLLGKH